MTAKVAPSLREAEYIAKLWYICEKALKATFAATSLLTYLRGRYDVRDQSLVEEYNV